MFYLSIFVATKENYFLKPKTNIPHQAFPASRIPRPAPVPADLPAGEIEDSRVFRVQLPCLVDQHIGTVILFDKSGPPEDTGDMNVGGYIDAACMIYFHPARISSY